MSKNCVSQLVTSPGFQDHVTLSLNQPSLIWFNSDYLFYFYAEGCSQPAVD